MTKSPRRNIISSFIPDANQHGTIVILLFQEAVDAVAPIVGTLGIFKGVVAPEAGIGLSHRYEMGAELHLSVPAVV